MKKNKESAKTVRSTSEKLFYIFTHIFMIALCLTVVFAFLLLVGSSLQSQEEILNHGYRIIPKSISFEAYQKAFEDPTELFDSYMVTIITTVIGTVLGVLFTGGYAYAISRPEFAYRKAFSVVNLFSMLFNGGMVATYIVYVFWYKMENNIWVLIWPLLYSPWNVTLMKSFFTALPNSIIEAARIDGAGELHIFFKFVVPMSKPVFATIALFLALTYWNDFQTTLLYITEPVLRKLQYLLQDIIAISQAESQLADLGVMIEQETYTPNENLKMAMCVIAAGPMMCIFPFFQKYFTKGISLGGVKE